MGLAQVIEPAQAMESAQVMEPMQAVESAHAMDSAPAVGPRGSLPCLAPQGRRCRNAGDSGGGAMLAPEPTSAKLGPDTAKCWPIPTEAR